MGKRSLTIREKAVESEIPCGTVGMDKSTCGWVWEGDGVEERYYVKNAERKHCAKHDTLGNSIFNI